MALGSISFGNPEIHQHEGTILSEFQIGRLDVAMNDGRFLAMKVLQDIEQFVSPTQHQPFRLSAGPMHKLCQIFAGNVLHDQKIATSVAEHIPYAREAVVSQAL
ncbi:MAG: hypothetical protein QXS54_02515 [Candidatus Methanomethylicaceae archaeon]